MHHGKPFGFKTYGITVPSLLHLDFILPPWMLAWSKSLLECSSLVWRPLPQRYCNQKWETLPHPPPCHLPRAGPSHWGNDCKWGSPSDRNAAANTSNWDQKQSLYKRNRRKESVASQHGEFPIFNNFNDDLSKLDVKIMSSICFPLKGRQHLCSPSLDDSPGKSPNRGTAEVVCHWVLLDRSWCHPWPWAQLLQVLIWVADKLIC